MKKRFTKKHRAVSEVISTMLLLAIAVVGASLLTVFVNNFFQSSNIGHMESSPAKSLYLLSYDTRDNGNLMSITNLNNTHVTVSGNYLLCAQSCNANYYKMPLNGGTEFIIVQLVNKNAVSVYPDKIYVNNIAYTWDEKTANHILTLSDDSSSGTGKYPLAGKFSILPTNSLTQTGREIQSGKTVNILIKLSNTVNDIYLDKSFQIRVNIGELNSKDFVIASGAAQ